MSFHFNFIPFFVSFYKFLFSIFTNVLLVNWIEAIEVMVVVDTVIGYSEFIEVMVVVDIFQRLFHCSCI